MEPRSNRISLVPAGQITGSRSVRLTCGTGAPSTSASSAKLLAQYGLTDRPADGWSSALDAQAQIPASEEQDLAAPSTWELRVAELKAQTVNTRPVGATRESRSAVSPSICAR